MRIGLICFIIGIVTAGNVMLQTADHNIFAEVFNTYAKSSEFGGRLFGDLSLLIQKGATLQDLNEHVEELRSHIAEDQAEDDEYYTEKQKQLEAGLEELASQVDELKQARDATVTRQQVLKQQQQIIDGLFANDQVAYQKRLGNQNSILEMIDALIQRVNQLLTEGHSLIEKDNLLEEIKQLGRGKHVEVLAQITSHLDNEQVDKILELFYKLRDAVLNSLEADEAKEQHNIQLYNKLTNEISVSITEAAQKYVELDAIYYGKQLELSDRKQAVADVGEKLQDRNDQRTYILDRIEEAKSLLLNNIDRIARWAVESE